MADRTLRIVIAGEASGSVKAAHDAEQALGGLDVTMKGVSSRAIAVGVALGQVMFEGAKKAVEVGKELVTSYAAAGSQIHNLALRTGFSTVALSEWKYAADQSGTSLDGLEVGIRKMEKAVVAANDGQKASVETLAAVGVSIDDLRGKRPEEIFERIVIGLGGVDDETTQAALATELFGKSGTQLLPILKDGADNMANLRKEAHDIGIVFSQEDANAAKEFSGSMLKMNREIEGVKYQIGRELMPVLQPMVAEFGAWVQQNGADFARDLAVEVKNVAGELEKAAGFVNDLSQTHVGQFVMELPDMSKLFLAAAAFAVTKGNWQVAAGFGALAGAGWLGGQIGAMNDTADIRAATGFALSDSDIEAIRKGASGLGISPAALASTVTSQPGTIGGPGGGASGGIGVMDRGVFVPIGQVGGLANFDVPFSVAPAARAAGGGLGGGGVHLSAGGGGAGGGSAAKVDPLVQAWERIHADMMREQEKVLLTGDMRQLDILKEKQAAEVKAIQEMAQRAHDIIGMDMADAVTAAFQDMRDAAKTTADIVKRAGEDQADTTRKMAELEADWVKDAAEAAKDAAKEMAEATKRTRASLGELTADLWKMFGTGPGAVAAAPGLAAAMVGNTGGNVSWGQGVGTRPLTEQEQKWANAANGQVMYGDVIMNVQMSVDEVASVAAGSTGG